MAQTITLNKDLPIETKHGAVKGKTFAVTKVDAKRSKYYFTKYYFTGLDGSECAAYEHEVKSNETS